MTSLVAETKRVELPGYRILEVRGVGAMATVYRALQERLDREVALKVLHEFVATDDEYRERFLREARAAAKLSHKNVVRAYEAGEHEGAYFFAMEYVEGEDLSERLGREGSLSEDEALYVAIEVARAIEAAAEHGMVHRDVKPENILLGDDGEVKLADLGLAKVQGDGSITAEGYSLGTVAFFSPEQCRGHRRLDVRSDLFALGGTIYAMLTGELPFGRGDNPALTMKRILEEWPPDIDDPSKFSTATREALGQLMAKAPEDRPPDAAAAIRLLERTLGRLGESKIGPVEVLREKGAARRHLVRRSRRRRRMPARSGVHRGATGVPLIVLALAALSLGILFGALPVLDDDPLPTAPTASPEPTAAATGAERPPLVSDQHGSPPPSPEESPDAPDPEGAEDAR